MKRINHENLRRRKEEIDSRMGRRNYEIQPLPMLSSVSPTYEVSGRICATAVGGIGVIHRMVRQLRLDRKINECLPLLKRHIPYSESDHVLNMAYNLLAGGTKLEDIELLRQDVAYMDMLGADRVPDPTTAGDFLRRLGPVDIEKLMDVLNVVRVGIWKSQPKGVPAPRCD